MPTSQPTKTSRQPSNPVAPPPPPRISVLGCPVLVALCVLSACATETSEAAESTSRVAFLGHSEQPSQVQLTMRDINRPVDAIIGASAPTENVSLELPSGTEINVETNPLEEMISFELVATPVKGTFDTVAFDETTQSYTVRGLGWLDTAILLEAVNTTFAQPEYDYYPHLTLCNAAQDTGSVLTQLSFEVTFLNSSGQPVRLLSEAALVHVAFQGASVQSSVICGLSLEDGERTEVQIELTGGFEAAFVDPASLN